MWSFSTRSPSHESMAGRTVSDPSTATATTRIVAAPNPLNVGSPVRNIPAIAMITVSPEMSTERPDVAAAISSASSSLLPSRALLTLPLQIEHRVVDADGEPDQEDDRSDALVHRQDLAGDREQSHRRDHGSQPEQQRNARRYERSEREEQDPERDRKRKLARFLEVVREHAAELLVGTCGAELLDHEVGVRRLRRGCRVEYRLNAILGRVGITGHLEIDQHRVTVCRDEAGVLERRFEVRDRLIGLQTLDDVADHSLEFWVERRSASPTGRSPARLPAS